MAVPCALKQSKQAETHAPLCHCVESFPSRMLAVFALLLETVTVLEAAPRGGTSPASLSQARAAGASKPKSTSSCSIVGFRALMLLYAAWVRGQGKSWSEAGLRWGFDDEGTRG